MTITKDNATGVLAISGTLEIGAAESLREALVTFLPNQSEVSLDLSEVDECDTAALQVLLAARRNAASLGKPFHFRAVSKPVTEIAEALGLSINGFAGGTGKELRDAS